MGVADNYTENNMAHLKVVNSATEAISSIARRRPRPYTTFYFKRGQMSPIRVARSTSPTAALCAVVRRIGEGEPIYVAEIINSNGKLLKTVRVHYRKIEIK
jgi:hypothetical protein